MAIILPNSFQSALIFFTAGIDERVGYATASRQFFLSRVINLQETTLSKHQVYYYTDLLKSLNLNLTNIRPQLFLSDEEKNLGRELLRAFGINRKGRSLLVGFNPGSSYGPAKCWAPERYAELANRLNQDFQAKIVLFGSREDMTIAARIESLAKGMAFNLAG